MPNIYNSAAIFVGGGGGGDSLWNEYITEKVASKNFDYLFAGLKSPTIDNNFLSGYDTSGVITTQYMFSFCTNLTSAPLFNTSSVQNMRYMFENCEKLTSVPLFDMSSATTIEYMFKDCKQLTSVPLFNTSNITDFTNMFEGCTSLTSVPLLNTSSATDMSGMFKSCTSLTSVPSLNTSNSTDMIDMFNSCKSITSIPPLNTDKVKYWTAAFKDCSLLPTIDITAMNQTTGSNARELCYGCYSLTKLIIRTMTKVPPIQSSVFTFCYHILGTVNSIYNPEGLADGYIYVPDAYVDQLKVATNWSAVADQIKPLSELEE